MVASNTARPAKIASSSIANLRRTIEAPIMSRIVRTFASGILLSTLQTAFCAAEINVRGSEVALRSATNIEGHCQRERLPDDRWIATEAALPQAVAQNDDAAARFVFIWQKHAAKQRLNPKQWK